MMESLLKRIENNRKAHSRWVALVLCLSMLVSLGTFAGFRQKAVAKTYTKEVLDCPYTHEGAEPVAHVHNDDCYDGEALVCALPEIEAHTHTEACFAEQRTLTCTLAENPGHQHGEACYMAREEMTCGLEENPGHVHNGTCFNDSGVLICTMAEGDGAHTHTADCFTTVYDLVCEIPEGEGAHTHTDECYSTERVMICDKRELPVHVHDAGCIRTEEITVDEPEETVAPEEKTIPEMPVSDPNADLETASDWEQDIEGLELSGNWARDLILVAATQQGRGESPNNFEAILNDAGDAWVTHGYTRYGAWYGVPYAEEWSAMFVSFCLRYAGIPEENVPNNPTAAFMAESFQKGELFAGRDYVPAVGDLIFFDTVDDEITNIDHMGIVYHVDTEDGTINTVEGDRTNAVATFGYHLDDEQIVGYGILPQNPDYIPTEENLNDETAGLIAMTTEEQTAETSAPAVPMPAQSWERTAGGIKVSVEAPEGAFPENTRIAVTPVNGNSLKDTVSDAVSGEVLEVQAVDITFFDAEGHEIEPAVPIRVSMTPAATEHAEEKTNVVHVDVAQQTAELVEQAAGTEFDNSEVVFDADAFTIYAIVYTYQVEYEYEVDGKTFTSSMPGAENMTLTQIVEGLGIVGEEELETFVSKIASIASTNEEVAIVTENSEIRVLKDGEAKIVITMQDGAKFHIDVRAEGETSAAADNTVISTVGELYLPENAVAKAKVVDGEQAVEAVKAETGEETEYTVFDISLENVDAEKYKEGFEVQVALDRNITGKDFRLYHVHDGQMDDITDSLKLKGPVDENGVQNVTAFSFMTESFSDFVLSYTVDFFYGEYEYHLAGGSSMLLSELFRILGINENVEDVANVIFTNPELVDISKNDDDSDWRLTSLQPFETVEALTIIFSDGHEIAIRVTDEQVSTDMRDAVKSATLNGQSGNDWTVRSDEEYTVHLEFVEVPGSVQFPTTSNSLVYQLPSTFNPHTALTGIPVVLTYTDKSVTHTLTGCTYDVGTDGKVTIHLTDEAKEKLAESGDGTFSIDVKGFFTEDATQADFGGGNKKNITVENDHDVSITKSGAYNSSDDKVHYSLTVKSKGPNTNINVSDVILGTALKFDKDSVTINPSDKEHTTTPKDNGFDMTINSMKNGESVTINYTASVDWNVIGTGKGNVEQTGNKVTVQSNEDPDPDEVEHDLNNRIDYNPMQKSAGTQTTTSDPNKKTVPWTITVNDQGLKDMANTTITDTIAEGSRSVMKYSGSGISIQKIDPATENPVGGPVSKTWAELGVDPDSATSWQYKITDSGKYKYVISYETTVDVTGQNGNTWVANRADDGDHGTGDVGQNVEPGTDKIGVDKQFGTATKDEMTWTVYLDVPANGLSKAIMTDTLPSADINGKKYRDTLKEGSVSVEGLVDGTESYKLTQSAGKFVITFYKDADSTVPGLTGTGNERRIKVTFTTENDETWVAVNRTGDHVNNVSFQGDNATVTDNDKGNIPQRGLEKTAHGTKTITNDDGESVLAFEYTLDLYGVNDADFTDNVLTITDDYNETYLKFLELRGYDHKYGIDTWFVQILQNGNNGGDIADRSKRTNDPAQISPTDNGGVLTFNINKSQFPTNADDSYYPRYQLRYYLVVKDAETQAKLLQDSLAASDRTIELKNKATWGDSDSEATVDYSYPGLVKENVTPTVEGADPNSKFDPATGMTGFKIVINPDMLVLNGGADMTLTDEYSGNLSVDYSSINIVIEKADDDTRELSVIYDYKENKGTFIIPDQCKVTITYNAKVVGTPSEWVTYGNEVKMNGFTDSTSGRAQISGTGEGGFNIYSVMLFKYDAGHMEKGLNNATFTMVDETGNPMIYPQHATNGKAGQPITFTTATVDGKPGYVDIRLNEQEDGISLQKGITYYLKETVSPETHAMNNTTYRFTISDNPNYANYEYHSGDILKIYDWPVLGRIEISKTTEGASNLTEEDKQKIKFEITGTYKEGFREGQPILLDDWGYAIPAKDLSKYDLSKCEEFKVEVTLADFTNDKYALEDLVDGNYVVKETSAALSGFGTVTTTYDVDSSGATEGTQASVTITSADKHTVAYTNKYENKTGDVDITIKKVHKDGTTSLALYGAQFKLERKTGTDAETGEAVYAAVTDSSVASDGTFSIPYENKDTGVTLHALTPGEYRITEVKAPENYKAMGDGAFTFTVNSDGSVTQNSGANFVDYTSSNTEKVFTVDNQEKHSYTITKVDGANVSLKLPGAEFGVFVHTTVEDDKTADKSSPIKTYTTDINGRFEIDTDDYAWDTTGKTTYYIQEIKAPAGYSLPSDPGRYYFYFGQRPDDVAQTAAVNLASGSGSRTITNDLIELEVQKLWKTLDNQPLNQDEIEEIEFKLFQIATVTDAKTGEQTVRTETQYPDADTVYTLVKESNWNSMKITKVPAAGRDENGNLITFTYRLEEVVPDGYEVVYTSENSGRKLIMTNRPESTQVHAKKVWADTPEEKQSAQSISFKLQRKLKTDTGSNWTDVPNGTKNVTRWDGSKNVPVNSDWSVDWDSLPTEYDYQVVEILGSNSDQFNMTYSTAEDGTIIVTNTYTFTEITVKKLWKDADSSHDWIAVALYRVSETYPNGKDDESPYKTGNIDPSKGELTFKDLEGFDDQGKEWKYYVVENNNNALKNYVVTYNVGKDTAIHSGTITITNEKTNEDKLAVKKLWLDGNGNPINPPEETDSISVTLQKKVGVPKAGGIPVTVNYKYYEWDGENSSQNKDSDSITVKANTTLVLISDKGPEDTISYQSNGTSISLKCIAVDGQITSTQQVSGKWAYTISVGTSPVTITANGSYGWVSTSFADYTQDLEYGNPVDVETQTLNASNNWAYKWNDLAAADNEIYFIKENTTVDGFTTTYENNDGVKTGIIYVRNTKTEPGSLKLKKLVTVNSSAPTKDEQKALVNGDYQFTITGPSPANTVVKYVQITVSGGVATSYKIAATEAELPSAQSENGDWATVSGLVAGEYTIAEIAPTNGMTLESAERGDGNVSAVTSEKTVKVIVASGVNTPADDSSAAAKFTNNVNLGKLSIIKTIQKKDGTNPATTDTTATGTFYYAVYAEAYDASADPAQTPVRRGKIEVTTGGTATVTEDNLPYGTYYVYELDGENGTPIVSGDDGVSSVINNTVYTVTGSGTSVEVSKTPSTAELKNTRETTSVTVAKAWSDAGHDSDTITYVVMQEAHYKDASNKDVVDEPVKYGDNHTITGSDTDSPITDLPVKGTKTIDGKPVVVNYEYFIVETSGKKGYTAIYTPGEEGGWTITNIKDAETDVDDELSVLKKWYKADGTTEYSEEEYNSTTNSIDVTMTQKRFETDYVPLTVQLYDAGNNNATETNTYYVKAGTNVAATFTNSGQGHRVKIAGVGDPYSTVYAGGSSSHTGNTRSFTVDSAMTVSFVIQSKNESNGRNDVQDTWGTAANETVWTYALRATNSDSVKSSVADLLSVATNGEAVDSTDYSYTITKDGATPAATYTGFKADLDSTNKWKLNFTELPVYHAGTEGKYNVFTYEISEVKVNNETVTYESSGKTGATSGFTVEVGEVSEKSVTIKNTEKDVTEITGTKKWIDNQERTHNNATEVVLKLERKLKSAEEIAWSIVEPQPEVTWTGNEYKFANLPKKDSSGNEYEYRVKETSVEVTAEGKDVSYGVTYSSGKEYALDNETIINTELTDFEFNKIWLSATANLASFTSSDQQKWPTGATIKVEITRADDTGFKLSYELNGTDNEFTPTDVVPATLDKAQYKLTKSGDGDYKFVLGEVLEAYYLDGTEVKAYQYVVKETAKPDDYGTEHYGKKEDGAWKYKADMVNGANDGDVIINQQTGGYALPQTGGIGTHLFTILGPILTLTSGAILTLRKRKQTA